MSDGDGEVRRLREAFMLLATAHAEIEMDTDEDQALQRRVLDTAMEVAGITHDDLAAWQATRGAQ